jgi:phosphate:Na+ symporter
MLSFTHPRLCAITPAASFLLLVLGFFACFPASLGFAVATHHAPSTKAAVPVDWVLLFIGLLGGLALFLYGLDKMADALKNVAGHRLRSILARLTEHRVLGLLTGVFATGITQSSSLTTVLMVGFVSAGLMNVQQTVAVVMGSNIGTTINAQLIAFQISKYAFLLVALGFAGQSWLQRDSLQRWAGALMGLGLIFVGMEVMSQAMRPLQSYPPFLDGMAQMRNPLLGMFAGAIFTGIIQSSAATVGVIIALASQGLIQGNRISYRIKTRVSRDSLDPNQLSSAWL